MDSSPRRTSCSTRWPAELDHLPHGGAARVKAAEITLRTLTQAGGALVALPDAPPPARDAAKSTTEQLRELAEDFRKEKERH